MGKVGKILGGLIALVVIVVVGVNIAVRTYLTDERIKGLVVPQAEKALGRKVDIGEISVGLLKGITIRDFSVKENNGTSNFIKIDSFVV